jgi:Peptidase family S51
MKPVKLYFSSYRIGADRNAWLNWSKHLGGKGSSSTTLMADRLRIFARESDDLSARGFECEELDLRSYFDDLEGLTNRLSHLQFLRVMGGNTFVLARAMTPSRLTEALRGPLSVGRLAAETSQVPV